MICGFWNLFCNILQQLFKIAALYAAKCGEVTEDFSEAKTLQRREDCGSISSV